MIKCKAARSAVLTALAAIALAGCDAATLTGGAQGEAAGEVTELTDPNLLNPQEGDIWTAELTSFSGYAFGDNSGEETPDAYGMMKIVSVSDDQIELITEMGGWPEIDPAVKELRGDHSEVTWDESETIPVNRADLLQLVADRKIIETRRMGE